MNVSCEEVLNDTAVNSIMQKLHMSSVSIRIKSAFLPLSAPATTFLCQRYCSVSDRMTMSCSVAPVGAMLMGHLPSEKKLMHGESLPRTIFTRYTTTQTSCALSPCSTCSHVVLIALNSEWTINDVYSACFLLCFIIISSFPFK